MRKTKNAGPVTAAFVMPIDASVHRSLGAYPVLDPVWPQPRASLESQHDYILKKYRIFMHYVAFGLGPGTKARGFAIFSTNWICDSFVEFLRLPFVATAVTGSRQGGSSE